MIHKGCKVHPNSAAHEIEWFFLREFGILAAGVGEVASVGCCFIVSVKSDMFTVNKMSFYIHFVYSSSCQMQGCKTHFRQASRIYKKIWMI